MDATGAVIEWKLSTGGGTRTAYEQATRDLLAVLAKRKGFETLGSNEALKHLGIEVKPKNRE